MIDSRRFLLIPLASLLVFSGCSSSTTDSDKVAEAQSCLDGSTSSTALACMDKVEGIDSESANLIRCSANFIYQDFTDSTRLSSIADQMKNSGGSSTAAVGLLAFNKTSGSSSASDLANQTLAYCQAANSPGMTLLAGMAVIGTTISAVASSDVVTKCDTSSASYDATACQTAISDSVCGADATTLGQAAQATYSQACSDATQAQSSVCQQFAAIGASDSDAATVGTALQTQMNNNSACP